MPEKLPPLILLLDKDLKHSSYTSSIIEKSWFVVNRCHNHKDISRLVLVNKPHIIILNSNFEYPTTMEMMNIIKGNERLKNIPTILLLKKDEDKSLYKEYENSIEILYLPVQANNLITLIKNLLKKSNPVLREKYIKYQDVILDVALYRVRRKNKEIKLGPVEFKILELLITFPSHVFSREKIIDYIWGIENNIDTRTIDVHMNRLRNALKLKDDKGHFIKTIRSAGYCLNLPREVQ